MGPATPQCSDASVCKLHSDCCSCVALGPGESPPPCADVSCKTDTCTAKGLPKTPVACTFGQCTLTRDCDGSKVGCNSLPPTCAPGEVASVNGLCWGPCIAATECTGVNSCTDCTTGQVCVKYQALISTVRCVPVPAVCSAADCACMGPAVCVNGFGMCSGPGDTADIFCDCPVCGG